MVPVGEGAGVGGILSEFLTAPAPHASGAEGVPRGAASRLLCPFPVGQFPRQEGRLCAVMVVAEAVVGTRPG